MVTSPRCWRCESEHHAVVHAVDVVAGEDQHILRLLAAQVAHVLAHGVGGALVPVHAVGRLLGGKDSHKAFAEGVEVVGQADVAVERGRVELGDDEDAVDPRVQRVGDGDVDEAVHAAEGHCGFRAVLRQRMQPLTAPAAQY